MVGGFSFFFLDFFLNHCFTTRMYVVYKRALKIYPLYRNMGVYDLLSLEACPERMSYRSITGLDLSLETVMTSVFCLPLLFWVHRPSVRKMIHVYMLSVNLKKYNSI